MIFRVFVEKRKGFDVKAQNLKREIADLLGIKCDVRFLIRYDYQGERQDFERALSVVFSEPPVDEYFLEDIQYNGKMLCTEYLPGQYDQRADSAAQCVSMLTLNERPHIRCANVYIIDGVDNDGFDRIKKHLINPIESRECSGEKYSDLNQNYPPPAHEKQLAGFREMSEKELREFYNDNGFALSFADLRFIQDYFKQEGRDPFYVELKVLDTYWSDHCRHTTFNTRLKEIKIQSQADGVTEAYELYKRLFEKHYGGKPDKYPSLMNIATIGARELKSQKLLPALDESEEINACSIKVKAKVDGREEDWTVMFKNETHNHPTEIEPFGGAATCLGGSIRDPLSGRVYVYQSMRVSGAADINAPLKDTLQGKLPQRVISSKAAAGFSSYGNQIGLSTGLVKEFYHKGYAAKRLEAGFVVGAAPSQNIIRAMPKAGDIVLLIGGRTGRDGCGGATGSSKAHSEDSITLCGAEVQKGDPLTERKLQRLFKNPEFAKKVKRCNDFGAGGVSVAVGELSRGMDINLDLIPKKYHGLSGTELAISESQERMAVVIAAGDLPIILKLCAEENLEATKVADITAGDIAGDINSAKNKKDDARVRMFFGGKAIVDLKRDFLDTAGVSQTASAVITDKKADGFFNLSEENQKLFNSGEFVPLLKNLLSGPNEASQKGLIELFDSTIGSATVLMPLGGKHQLSPSIAMAAKLPVAGETDTATVAAYGFDPYLSELSPFTGAAYAVTESVVKAAVAGADYNSIYLTLQEFFEKLKDEPARWGKPAAALLGALYAQIKLGKAAIGGKDSMSGSFNELDVPPTLISFALGTASAGQVVGSAASGAGVRLYRYRLRNYDIERLDRSTNNSINGGVLPDFDKLKLFLAAYQKNLKNKNIDFATTAGQGGVAAAAVKAALGNALGVEFYNCYESLFIPAIGDVIFGVASGKRIDPELLSLCEELGVTTEDGIIRIGHSQYKSVDKTLATATALKNSNYSIQMDQSLNYNLKTAVEINELCIPYLSLFKKIFPLTAGWSGSAALKDYKGGSLVSRAVRVAKPKVFIPVFPGTNCEYDSARQFIKAGASVDTFIIQNLTAADLKQSIEKITGYLNSCNILMLPGGFSGGDEPDGSGKFINALFQNPYVAEALNNLLYKRDGLALGICNGFQALIKLGLLPYGKIQKQAEDSPTLTFNNISRHISQIIKVRVSSNLSPWFNAVKVGEVFNQAVSHGEGRFIATPAHIKAMEAAGQIVTQYADLSGKATIAPPYNPNGSVCAAEGITSPDGRVLGKMGHAERIGNNLYKNIDNDSFDMRIFESGVRYFD